MNNSQALFALGQSIWFDNVDRSLIMDGWFAEQIQQKRFVGVTSNPSIFQKAISSGNAYTLDIQTMSWSGLDADAIHENLMVADIRQVADLLAPVYQETEKKDGYVSLEVNPLLANNAEQTIREAKRLWQLVDKENLMIKIPATMAGISAIKEAVAAGINVNVTLIFSTERYLDVLDAYYRGIELRVSKGLPVNQIHSVASFFISRMDVMIEEIVADYKTSGKEIPEKVKKILGKIGIQNGLNAYAAFEESIASKRFQKIRDAGGNIQRPLWASTGTKNPAYSDVLYVDEMILPHTVNTVPPETLQALLDHGKTERIQDVKFRENFEDSKGVLESIGIDLKRVFEDLENEGVEKFASAQTALLAAIENERSRQLKRLVVSADEVSALLRKLEDEDFVSRFYQPDASLFTSEPEEEDEVLQRLGWIDAPETSRSIIPTATDLLTDLIRAGFSHTVVLGMGGSSLAPEVFGRVFAKNEKGKEGLILSILDSTDPGQIKTTLTNIPTERTLFIASSKTGTTVEMKSLVAYILKLLADQGINDPGSHFICITDPGTPLASFALQHGFRAIIEADPNVGGRYSALIAFGLAPAVLAGIDANQLLDSAQRMRALCGEDVAIHKNPAFVLAALLAAAYAQGADKLTILADAPFTSFGSWLEQLVAESSGKNEEGLIPVDLEPAMELSYYSKDRIFYYLRHNGNNDALVDSLQENGFNVIVSTLDNEYAIAGEMVKWEFTIAAFCSMIGVNPFNQPNVQASKSLSIKMLEDYKVSPIFDEGKVISENEFLKVFGRGFNEISDRDKILSSLFEINDGDYISINAFLPRIDRFETLLQGFRKQIGERYAVPVTLGFGPRYLHSTGQLHKGGKNNGIFIILTQEPATDLAIPGEGITFSTLEKAQALGDMRALEAHDRRVIRVHFKAKIGEETLSLLV